MEAFCRHVGMSNTAVYGVIKEDTTRYSEATQSKFLQKISISLEQWYGE